MKFRKKHWICIAGLSVVIIAVIIVSLIFFVSPNSKTVSKKEQQQASISEIAQPKGKWSGKQKYPDGQYVSLTVRFLKNRQYRLVEVNTVSQCWTRTYYGSYHKNKNQLVFIPHKIIVRTFITEAEMKTGNSSAQEQIQRAQFYKQFGNQQTSKLTLQHHQIKINHDHEKIVLHRKN